MAEKKYIVELNLEERVFLDEFIHKGRHSAELVTRARILLKADVSEAGDGDRVPTGGVAWTEQAAREARSP